MLLRNTGNQLPVPPAPDKIDNKGNKGYSGDDDGPKKKPDPKPDAKQKPDKDQKKPTKLDVEEATRLRAQSQLGRELKHADNPRIEWIDDAGRTYDQMGSPNMIPHWDKQRTQFFKQIDKHLKKADHPVIDLTDFPNNIIDDVNGYINKLPADQAARIVKIGF